MRSADAAARQPQGEVPPPLTESPPADRFCDLIINGGVASGVVYPWAIVRLARDFRFRNIGGNSVGAMAAAMAAAAEYGRCTGHQEAFEPLRRMPGVLAESDLLGRAKMLRLFVPTPGLERLFELFLCAVSDASDPIGAAFAWPMSPDSRRQNPVPDGIVGWIATLMRVYALWPWALAGMLTGLGMVLLLFSPQDWHCEPAELLSLSIFVLRVGIALGLVLLLGLAFVLWRFGQCFRADLIALERNGYGLCTGRGIPGAAAGSEGEEALTEWLHRGIQLSAGRQRGDAPLSFADLWGAPRQGRQGPLPRAGGQKPPDAAIDLQMFSTNISLGRPLRLPLNDVNTRLFYRRCEWEAFFPAYLLDALDAVSRPYQPLSKTEPDLSWFEPGSPDWEVLCSARELPGADMPIVIAARMSLSFPLLFSCLPVWAIDYEAKTLDEMQSEQALGTAATQAEKSQLRRLRKCLLTDGGLCSNFPVHLFDSALPRWPTFALQLDARLQAYKNESVWLPLGERDGRADNWQRSVPGVMQTDYSGLPLGRVLALAGGMIATMKDWNDRVLGRLPHVRNRIVRINLRPEESQLHIGMPGDRILRMAHEYGTVAGDRLVRAYAPTADGQPSDAWRQHLFVRSMIELRSLRAHLHHFGLAAYSHAPTLSLRELLREASQRQMLLGRDGQRADPKARPSLEAADLPLLERLVDAIEALECELLATDACLSRYQPRAEPELRLRAPV